MSDDKKAETTEKKSSLGVIIFIFLVIAVSLGAGLYSNYKKAEETSQIVASEDAPTDTDETTTEITSTEETNAVEASEDETQTVSESQTVELDIEALAKPRILGDKNAPLKITEHASFSCHHCGAFHKGNFKNIKRDYIDTGKAYLVFDDFPLGGADIIIGAIARCVPDQSYFNFVQLIFETQDDWGDGNQNYTDYMKRNAVLAGADSAVIDSCASSTELQQRIAQNRETARKSFNVSSTPTLIVNDTIKIEGGKGYQEIQETLDKAYETTTSDENPSETVVE